MDLRNSSTCTPSGGLAGEQKIISWEIITLNYNMVLYVACQRSAVLLALVANPKFVVGRIMTPPQKVVLCCATEMTAERGAHSPYPLSSSKNEAGNGTWGFSEKHKQMSPSSSLELDLREEGSGLLWFSACQALRMRKKSGEAPITGKRKTRKICVLQMLNKTDHYLQRYFWDREKMWTIPLPTGLRSSLGLTWWPEAGWSLAIGGVRLSSPIPYPF